MSDSRAADRRFDRLTPMLGGYELTQMLYVFAELGIPDLLAGAPRTAEELAGEAGAHAPSLHRLLRALSSVRVVARDEAGRFVLTRTGARLRADVEGSLRPIALAYGQRWWWEAWGGLLAAVRTGETAFEHVHGRPLYDFLEDDPAASAAFGGLMTARSAADFEAVADAFDFSKAGSILDVGGGRGALLEAILARYPGLRATLFETPATIEQARRELARGKDPARVDLVGGDFFDAVPEGFAVYTLMNVLHNWDDDPAVRILRAIRAAIPAHGVLLVIQHVIGDDDAPSQAAKLLDVALLVSSGGRQRTEAEYGALLGRAGFVLDRVLPTASGISVIEARPV